MPPLISLYHHIGSLDIIIPLERDPGFVPVGDRMAERMSETVNEGRDAG